MTPDQEAKVLVWLRKLTLEEIDQVSALLWIAKREQWRERDRKMGNGVNKG